jgi:hypothetical protein
MEYRGWTCNQGKRDNAFAGDQAYGFKGLNATLAARGGSDQPLVIAFCIEQNPRAGHAVAEVLPTIRSGCKIECWRTV